MHYALHGFHELSHQPTIIDSEIKAKEYENIIKLLIKKGAKPYQRDERGRNALHLVLQFGYTNLIEIIADSKSCSTPASSGVIAFEQSFKNWNIFHFLSYTRYRWKMITNLLLKESSKSTNFSQLKKYFSTIWSNEYNNLEIENVKNNFVITREESWDIVSQHSLELAEKVISSCSEYSTDFSNLLLSKSDENTPFHIVSDSGDSKLLEFYIKTISQGIF